MPPLLVNIGGNRWVQPLGLYATTISHAIAPGFFAGRRASIFVASVNVALIFLVAWRVFARYLPALGAALILMFTPAHFAFGRVGIDAIYVIPFILIWLYAVLEFVDKDRPAAMAVAAAALGAGVYSAPSAPLTMMFLWITMMVALWVARRRKLSTLLIAAGTFVATLVPLMVWFYLHPADLPGHLRTLGDFCGALAQSGGWVPGVGQHQHAGHARLRVLEPDRSVVSVLLEGAQPPRRC